jgi:hypothetical protein
VIRGGLDKPERFADLENALRDKNHVVSGSGARPDSKLPNMPWRFEETITISAPGKAAPASGTTAKSKMDAIKSGTGKQGGQQ